MQVLHQNVICYYICCSKESMNFVAMSTITTMKQQSPLV